MLVTDRREGWLVGMAIRGHERALDELIERHLPLVNNIVGHCAGDNAEVDGLLPLVVERIRRGAPALADPMKVRAWAAAKAVLQVREWLNTSDNSRPQMSEEDFVAHATKVLGLSGQLLQVTQAARWLAQPDREVLSLWRMAEIGELTPDELTVALTLVMETDDSVRRMRDQLERARRVVAALDSRHNCPDLAMLAATRWESPSPKRLVALSRHVDGCIQCVGFAMPLVPVRQLLVGMALVRRDLSAYLATNDTAVRPAALVESGPSWWRGQVRRHVRREAPFDLGELRDRWLAFYQHQQLGRFIPSTVTVRQRRMILGLAVTAVFGVAAGVADFADRSTVPQSAVGAPPPVSLSPTTVNRTTPPPAPTPMVAADLMPTIATAPTPSPSTSTVDNVVPVALITPIDRWYEAETARLVGEAELVPMTAASGGTIVQKLGTDTTSSNPWPGYGYGGGSYGGYGSHGTSGAIEFTGIAVPKAGQYTMTVYYISGESRDAWVQVNGGSTQALSFPSGGSWDRVTSATFTVTLGAGNNRIMFSNPSGWAPRLDRIKLRG
jgi:hypothetical protein